MLQLKLLIFSNRVNCVSVNNSKVNLLDLDYQRLSEWCTSVGEKPYRAQQLMRWIHQVGQSDFDGMTNLSKVFREKLARFAEIRLPELVGCQESKDGTHKWLLKLSCGNCIETVFIPEKTRGTLCISSQVGCALNCSFCSTGKQGFNRNLTTAEIIGQLWFAVRTLSEKEGLHDRKITNVVMMGMGEPLLNFDNVVAALDIMMHDFGYGLSKRRVTLSTSGIVPEMERLRMVSPVSLAVSLHAPNDELRDILVPINKKYPLKMLMDLCRRYFKDDPRRYITFEYVMLKGVNDSLKHADELVRCLRGIPSKVNLIPFNPFPMTQYERSSQEAIDAFRNRLISKGLNTITRKTRGDDIDAACGQLAGSVKDKTRRSAQWQKIVFERTQSNVAQSPS